MNPTSQPTFQNGLTFVGCIKYFTSALFLFSLDNHLPFYLQQKWLSKKHGLFSVRRHLYMYHRDETIVPSRRNVCSIAMVHLNHRDGNSRKAHVKLWKRGVSGFMSNGNNAEATVCKNREKRKEEVLFLP